MKILFISMSSVHVTRWIENLSDSQHELYWFDVLGRGRLDTLESVKQFTVWKKRKIPYLKGEYFLSKKLPSLFEKVVPFLEVTANEALEKIILELKPDVVHSFEMQSCCYPILKTMNKFQDIKWLYSCWGNDLYYYQQFPLHLKKIKKVLQRVNFLHTDCNRDFGLAKQLGFSGKHVGVIPGGTGYQLAFVNSFKSQVQDRKIILIKGYQNVFGRSLIVLKAIQDLQTELQNFEIVVFGAHQKVIDFVRENQLNIKVYHRHELSHLELMQLMGKTLIYIGNNISDGMPNTLLEAIVMGAFPIQSNPGGASGEIINNGANGFLIENPESNNEIKQLIIQVISDKDKIKNAYLMNEKIAEERLEYKINKQKVVEIYNSISKSKTVCE
jgi:glycosyltransferase involved in cell wall biosynthesis